MPHFTENLEVFSGYLLPDCVTAECIGVFAHDVPVDIVVQKGNDLFRHGIRIVEGHNPAPVFGKHLGGIPVRGRNDGFACAHGIGKAPGGNLGFFKIRGYVYIGDAEKLT